MIGAITNPHSKAGKVQLNKETTGANIYIGDIIKLHHNEIAPCDFLILASSEDLNGIQICRVDTKYDDGKILRQVKEAISLTKSFSNYARQEENMKKFLERLHARVQYEKKDDKITGWFKLKADPRVENFTDAMVIRKGAIIKSSFFIGLVLYNGRQCLGNDDNKRVLSSKLSAIQNKIYTFSLTMIAFNFILCILLTLAYSRLRIYTDATLKTDISKTGFLTFVSLFFSVMPLTINILIRVFHLISAYKLQKKFRGYSEGLEFRQMTKRLLSSSLTVSESTPTKKTAGPTIDDLIKDSFNVLNPNVVDDLGDVDDAFFDKTGTLTAIRDKYEVTTITTRSKMYQPKTQKLAVTEAVAQDYDLDERPFPTSVTPTKKKWTLEEPAPTHLLFRSSSHLKEKKVLHEEKNFALELSPVHKEPEITDDSQNPKKERLMLPPLLTEPAAPYLETEREKLNAEKHNHSPKLKIKGEHANQKVAVSEEDHFYTDLFNSSELKELLTMFIVCHKARVAKLE